MDTDFDSILTASSLSEPDKDKIRRLMAILAKSSKDMTGDELLRAREAAGLSVGQAAKLIDIGPLYLMFLENNVAVVPMGQVAKFDEVYGLNAEARK